MTLLRPDERTRCDRCRNYDGARCRAAPPCASSPSMVAYWPLVAPDDWCATFFLDRGKRPELVAAEAERDAAIREITERP